MYVCMLVEYKIITLLLCSIQYLENDHLDAEKEEEVVRFKFDKSYNQIQLKLNDPQAGWTVKPLMVPVTVCYYLALNL